MAVLVRDLFEIDFDHSRTARLDVLGMLSLSPLDLVTGQPVAVAQLLDEGDPLCRPVIPLEFPALSAHLVHGPTEAPLRDLLLEATLEQLASHGVTLDARAKLAAGDIQGFLADRADVLKGVIAQHIDRMAEWGARDDIRARDLMRLGG
jgi:hypothetical protein